MFDQKAYYKEWYKKNKKKMKLYMRAYRHNNPKFVERQRKKARKPNGYIARRKKKCQEALD